MTCPPLGLAIVMSSPSSVNTLQAWMSSDAQNPTGPPRVVETAGFDTTIKILRGSSEILSMVTDMSSLF